MGSSKCASHKIDLEKAFDKVEKNGLTLSMHQIRVKGHMYNWISQYLTSLCTDHKAFQKKTLKTRVPQGVFPSHTPRTQTHQHSKAKKLWVLSIPGTYEPYYQRNKKSKCSKNPSGKAIV